MPPWILIFFAWNNVGMAAVTVEFHNREACELAGRVMTEAGERPEQVRWRCVAKGTR